jgi:hypothetical protein
MFRFSRSSHPHSCAKCGSLEIMRSHRRNPLEVMLSAFILPWRCRVCFHRFYRWRSQNQPQQPPASRTATNLS